MRSSFWSASAWVFASQILIFLQSFLLIPILISACGVETYGSYSVVNSLLALAFGLSTLGVGYRAKRFLPSAFEISSRCELFFPQLYWNIAVLFIFGIVGSLIAGFVHAPISAAVIFGYFFSYLCYAQAVEYFRYTNRVLLFNAGTILLPYLFMGLVIGSWYLGLQITVSHIIFSYSVAAIIVGGLLGVRVLLELGIQVRFPTFEQLQGELRYGLPFLFSYVVESILAFSDRFIIAGMLSTRDVGYYTPAYTLGMLILMIPKVLVVVLPVRLAHLVDEGRTYDAEDLVQKVANFFLALAIPFIVGSLVIGDLVLAAYTNGDVAMQSWGTVPVVGIGALFYGLIYIYIQVQNTRMKTKDTFQIICAAAVINVVLNLFLLPVFPHLIIPAITTAVAYALACLLLLKRVKGYWKISFSVNYLTRVLFASIIMGSVCWWLRGMLEATLQDFLLVIAIVIVSGMIYAVLCVFLGVLRKETLPLFFYTKES